MLSLVETPQSTAPGVRSLPTARRASRLAQLAEQIRQLQLRGRAPAARCPTGFPNLDNALGGGFFTAAVHELIATTDGTAAHSLALHTAARAAGENQWLLYLDTTYDLNPPGVTQLGVPLGRLIVVRTPHLADALWVAEQTLHCPAVAAVVLPLRNIDPHASRRLQLAAEAGGGLGFLLRSTAPDGPTFAASRLRLEPLDGAVTTRRMQITILKQREGPPCAPFVVELPDAADFVPAHAVLRDRPDPARWAVGG
jgi:protein ImuA